MRRCLTRAALALTLSTLLFAPLVTAQVPDPVRHSAVRPASSSLWGVPQESHGVHSMRIATSGKRDYTVLGLVIGAGLGFAAGWGFYNAMCEAVDNDCNGTRRPYLIIGTGLGAGLGALIGSAAD